MYSIIDHLFKCFIIPHHITGTKIVLIQKNPQGPRMSSLVRIALIAIAALSLNGCISATLDIGDSQRNQPNNPNQPMYPPPYYVPYY